MIDTEKVEISFNKKPLEFKISIINSGSQKITPESKFYIAP